MVYLFDFPAFFILLRQTLECIVILSVLFGFIDQLLPNNDLLKRKLKRNIWAGIIAGIIVAMLIGVLFVVFYVDARNLWREIKLIWEGTFYFIIAIIITFADFHLVRINQWEPHLKDAVNVYLEKHQICKKWALFLLSFSLVLRAVFESIVFIAGNGFSTSRISLPAITAITIGIIIGYVIYCGSLAMNNTTFFTAMITFLFFISAGSFSNSVGKFQTKIGKIDKNDIIWDIDCCISDGWSFLNSLFGFRTTATVWTTVGYFSWWAMIIIGLLYVHFDDKRRVSTNNK
ncbi:12586_t:CDS:2 [Ambispora gerdemannii]|uniref:12586_t:CDS:1 n=1 Tax=Ambispora gerdemannii TaxID=144530 RepID=A0A9N8ZLF3_9GLOM|nr:12586_t:CDS:2 [Ambispora gerdemannii]